MAPGSGRSFVEVERQKSSRVEEPQAGCVPPEVCRSQRGSSGGGSSGSNSHHAPQHPCNISLEDWARRGSVCTSDLLERPRGTRLTAPPESDASLGDLLAPLVAERMRHNGRIAPPEPLEFPMVFAAISAIAAPTADPGAQWSHFMGACESLATCGFRRCSLVVDKLGISVRCVDEQDVPGRPGEQVDFPWSSISDVQDPRLKNGLQGCAVTLGIREPARLFEGPAGALALALRLSSWEDARNFADAALAFKAYEAQMAVWNSQRCHTEPSTDTVALLLLDERGYAFWSINGEEEAEPIPEPSVDLDVMGPVTEGNMTTTPCCTLCWC